ncbi:MAG: 23S rRNA (pseudouridine(1915)-N(3))-methyltransferase RlmH [Clostridiales bacterium]|jgi:23S rRNA (pseudouridine1915-N3)-methyltransferase|nr:23S rRNA (pseudouridine(1915)-N(3))-methyltransferase RlmH [Clostridiales bacterium]
MLSIKIICVGKLKELYFNDAVIEYWKRLTSYCRLEIEEIPESRHPENPSQAEIHAALLKEAEGIERRIPRGALVVALSIEGKELDSIQMAKFIQLCAVQGKNRICFIIGGSRGLHGRIKARADVNLSMSKMTFPHHLARVMLLEQLYRSFKIAEGSKYHK